MKSGDESVEGKDLKGGMIDIKEPEPGIKPKIITAKKIIDKRSVKKLDFELVYDKKRKCYIKRKKK